MSLRQIVDKSVELKAAHGELEDLVELRMRLSTNRNLVDTELVLAVSRVVDQKAIVMSLQNELKVLVNQ